MGKSAPSPPPAPDYAAAATAQGVANKDSAIATASLGNPNVNSPYGNQTVTYAPTGPDGNQQPTINQTLTPQAQRTLDAQQRVQTGLANLGEKGLSQVDNILGTPFQYSGQGIQTGLDTSNIAKMPVNAGMTGQQAILDRLNPQLDRQDSARHQMLANQGIGQGSEAYRNSETDAGQQRNDLISQAALQGLNLDMSANQQGFNQAERAGQFGNTASLQNLQQQLGLYNQPLNQISALMSGSQIQAPQFQQYSGANVGAAPVFQGAQAQGQYNTDLYGQQMAGYNSQMGALGNIAGSALGMFSFT